MKVCRTLGVFALALLIASPALAQSDRGVFYYHTTDKGGTLTTGGVAQNAIAYNGYRQIWCIQNDPEEEEVLMVRLGGTASATAGIALSPGQQACSAPNYSDRSAVSVYAATTGHRWFGFEGE